MFGYQIVIVNVIMPFKHKKDKNACIGKAKFVPLPLKTMDTFTNFERKEYEKTINHYDVCDALWLYRHASTNQG